MKKYYGDETRWFLGTVVNVNDPLELGRVLVRIYGIHSSANYHRLAEASYILY